MEYTGLLSNLYVNNVCLGKNIPSDNYLKHLPVVKNLKKMGGIRFRQNVTFLVGENGVGKSTLIEGIAVAMGFNPEGGTINFNFVTRESHSDLHQYLTVSRGYRKRKDGFFLRAESFYNVASKEEEYADEWHPSEKYHEKSHGESFLALAQNSFRPNGLYLLDEPEAALSPQRQLTLLIEIDRLAKQGAQFLIASHSPILLGIPGAQILSFDDGVIHECEYEDTDAYQVTEMFINNKEYFLKRLLEEQS